MVAEITEVVIMPAIRDLREIAALVRILLEGPNKHDIEYQGMVDGAVVIKITTTVSTGREWVNVVRFNVPESWLPWFETLLQDLADSYSASETFLSD